MSDEYEVNAVKELLLNCYINGAFNKRDLDAMRRGFHEDFAIFSAEGNALGKFHLKDWLAKLQKSLDEGYDRTDPKNKWEHKFVYINVTGVCAHVKLELYNEGVHIYTDFVSLLKFDSGWRIAAKIYNQHNERRNW